MPIGGARPGSGRKKGSKQKTTLKTTLMALTKLGEGAMPLEVMLTIMRDPQSSTMMKAAMAKEAAPYCHPRLQAIAHSGPGGGPIPVAIQNAKVEIAGMMADLVEKLDAAKPNEVNPAESPSVSSDALGGESGTVGSVSGPADERTGGGA